MDYERLLLTHKISEEFIEHRSDGKYFCILLFDDDSHRVPIIFDSGRTFPVIDCVCEWLFKRNTSLHITKIIQKVNSCLTQCGRGLEITQDDLKYTFLKPEVDGDRSISFEGIDRRELWGYLARKIPGIDIRYIAHFLIPYDDVEKIFIDKRGDIEGVTVAVLESWDKRSPSWHQLKSVLNFLNMKQLIDDIEDLIKSGKSYQFYKNFREDIIVLLSFTTKQLNIQSHSENVVKDLKKDVDFRITENKGKMLIHVFKDSQFQPDKLEILSVDDSFLKISVPIEETPHLPGGTLENNAKVEISTHGYETIRKFIHLLDHIEKPKERLDYIPYGGNKAPSIPRINWYKQCQGYLYTYFALKDYIREAILFLPYRKGNKMSEFAYLLRNAFAQIAKVGVINGYDAEDHLGFFYDNKNAVMQKIGKLGNYQQRILIVYPNPIIIFNIRYTEAHFLLDLKNVLAAGENDIKSLLVLNKELLKEETVIFLNIVAAPNLDSFEDSNICGKCHVMDRKTVRNYETVIEFFQDCLRQYHNNGKSKKTQSTFIKILGNIFGFLATRKSIRSYVPAFDGKPTEQVKTLLLNTDQLEILYSEEKKKFICGHFGSGKSLLGLYQMQDLAQSAKTKTDIFYISWDINSIINHVKVFCQSFSRKEFVTTHILNVKEISTHLQLNSVPSVAFLLRELIRNYSETVLHVVIDEFDGEQLNLANARDLKETLKRRELEDSCITILCHSLQKKRICVSGIGETPHENYQFGATEVKIWDLKICMRTTESIFKLTREIEQKIRREKVVFHQPNQSRRVESGNSELAVKLSELAEEETDSDAVRLNTECADAVGADSDDDKEYIPNTNVDKVDFIVPNDFDLALASEPSRPKIFLQGVKTVTRYSYPETDGCGHNILGDKPVYLTFEEGFQSSRSASEHAHDLISKLAIIFDNSFFQKTTSKFVLCNTHFHYCVMKNALKLSNLDFVEFIEYSGWQLKDKNEKLITSPSRNCCMLTNYLGCRGNEADQVVVCVDPAAYKLKHLVLECMTRSRSDLLIIGINSNKTPTFTEQWLPHWLQKGSRRECSIGKILVDVAHAGFLVKNTYKSINRGEACWIKDKFQINIASRKYRENIMKLKQEEVMCQETESCKVDSTAFKMLHSASAVKNLRCTYKNKNECLLSWLPEGFNYIIQCNNTTSKDGWYEVGQTRDGYYTVTGMKNYGVYKFSVTAVSNVNMSSCTEVDYVHSVTPISNISSYIQTLIGKNKTDELKSVLRDNPSIVHVKNHDGRTPLMWTAYHTNSSTIVKLLIENESNVWTEDQQQNNSYHLAAKKGHSEVLKTLCRHDVAHINRVNESEQTPLHYAAWLGYTKCVKAILRQHNVDKSIKDNDGKTAYELAGEFNKQNREMIRDIIEQYER